MTKSISSGFLAAMLLPILLLAGGANAADDWMPTGGVTTQPIGHYDLCRRIPQECNQQTASGHPVEMTRELWSRMIEINNVLNSSITPRTDQEIWGQPEHWSYPDHQGDCEDFVLAKRKALMEYGVPAGSLLITVVRQQNGDGHAVLTVRTTMGDYILDNLEPRIMAWQDTDYRYLKRQSERYSGAWVKIMDGRTNMVGSVRN